MHCTLVAGTGYICTRCRIKTTANRTVLQNNYGIQEELWAVKVYLAIASFVKSFVRTMKRLKNVQVHNGSSQKQDDVPLAK